MTTFATSDADRSRCRRRSGCRFRGLTVGSRRVGSPDGFEGVKGRCKPSLRYGFGRHTATDETADETADTAEVVRVLRGFRVVYVFDIAATDGPPLAEVGPVLLTGDVAPDVWGRLAVLVTASGFRLERGWCQGANGWTDHARRTIRVLDSLPDAAAAPSRSRVSGHLHWLFQFTRALGAPDEVITHAVPNVDAVASKSFLYLMAQQRPWYELTFGGILGIENQIPPAYIRMVKGFREHYTSILQPGDYAFHTIHITVDEDHGGHVGEFAERYLDTDEKRRSAKAAYLAGVEITRRCWDAYVGTTC